MLFFRAGTHGNGFQKAGWKGENGLLIVTYPSGKEKLGHFLPLTMIECRFHDNNWLVKNPPQHSTQRHGVADRATN